ncbi:hypothetical protein PSU4_56600 [Pseudonocardia sulfidoxydans NBRC 16205]|uniref:Uncharacterized protein n=2 Tax=Pseudonocardia sulfidoxydans TaxID=54011 RepID=A0A511DPF3_9PSEU|nr:hypothetical protein PSU4_56600 [Pseudonocardia sulfidoxydans NBRC 16205]
MDWTVVQLLCAHSPVIVTASEGTLTQGTIVRNSPTLDHSPSPTRSAAGRPTSRRERRPTEDDRRRGPAVAPAHGVNTATAADTTWGRPDARCTRTVQPVRRGPRRHAANVRVVPSRRATQSFVHTVRQRRPGPERRRTLRFRAT